MPCKGPEQQTSVRWTAAWPRLDVQPWTTRLLLIERAGGAGHENSLDNLPDGHAWATTWQAGR